MAQKKKLMSLASSMSKKAKKHVKIEAPENWEVVYNNILEMRKDKSAPVDSMGCEKVQEMSSDPKVNSIILGIILFVICEKIIICWIRFKGFIVLSHWCSQAKPKTRSIMQQCKD